MMSIFDFEKTGQPLDISDIITHECPCGSDMWQIVATFDDYEIASYMLDMQCFYCGTRAKAPTPLDNPNTEEE